MACYRACYGACYGACYRASCNLSPGLLQTVTAPVTTCCAACYSYYAACQNLFPGLLQSARGASESLLQPVMSCCNQLQPGTGPNSRHQGGNSRIACCNVRFTCTQHSRYMPQGFTDKAGRHGRALAWHQLLLESSHEIQCIKSVYRHPVPSLCSGLRTTSD